MSRFADVEQPPKLEAFDLNYLYWQDKDPNKVNLATGVYRTEGGQPLVMGAVRRAELRVASDGQNHDYQPTLGPDSFCAPASRLLLGRPGGAQLRDGRAFGVQTLSGAGALRLGADFLVQQLGYRVFYYSDPTWGNHLHIFNAAGFTSAVPYRYWDPQTKGLDFQGLQEDLRAAPRDAVVLLHTCAHNPTGTDPTREQWIAIADIMEERGLFPFFDCSFQGLASGDLDEDAWSVRYFVQRGLELFCAQSFSKNFGLYNERAGNLLMFMSSPRFGDAVRGQLQLLVRGNYAYPADYGGRLVSTILCDDELYEEWKSGLREMCDRFVAMRRGLCDRLKALRTPGSWDHIVRQKGMICATGLTPQQCHLLVTKWHVYILSTGRINVTGLNLRNLNYVSVAIHDVIKNSTLETTNCYEGKRVTDNNCFPQ